MKRKNESEKKLHSQIFLQVSSDMESDSILKLDKFISLFEVNDISWTDDLWSLHDDGYLRFVQNIMTWMMDRVRNHRYRNEVSTYVHWLFHYKMFVKNYFSNFSKMIEVISPMSYRYAKYVIEGYSPNIKLYLWPFLLLAR